jgi:hypothetical protein
VCEAFPSGKGWAKEPSAPSLCGAQTKVACAPADSAVNLTAFLFYRTIHKRAILLFNQTIMKLRFEMEKSGRTLCQYEHTRCFHIKPMHDTWARYFSTILCAKWFAHRCGLGHASNMPIGDSYIFRF